MNNILLSICIPTYKQPFEVKRLLDSLAPQVNSSVEIIIRDDSPDTATEEIVRKFQNDISIQYFKGEKGGIDKAILFLTQKAKGKYIWWFGDDVMGKGAIDRILELVRRFPDISFIYLNYLIFHTKKLGIDLGSDKFFRDRNQVLEEIANTLGFISATVIMRERALSGISLSEKYIGSAYVNLYLVLHVLSQGGKFYFLNDPYVINYPGSQEKANDDGFEVFGVNFFRIVREFSNKFDKKSVKKTLSKNFGYVWRGVLVRWVTGYESPKGKRWQMLKLYWNFPGCWVALTFLFLPLFLNKLLYRSYKIFFNEREWKFGKKIV